MALRSCSRALPRHTPAGAATRCLCPWGRGLWQRSQPSPRGRHHAAASSSARSLLSPFGAALQGPSRGPQAAFAEPLEAWLAVLADTVPFYKDCLVVCSSTASPAQVRHVWNRSREHIPTAHVGSLTPRRPGSEPASSTPLVAAPAVTASPPPHTSSRTTPPSHPLGGGTVRGGGGPLATSVAARSVPSLHSPLEQIPAGSLDLVVFPGNVFAHEMLFDAPWHLSLAHRALRPHGVVAIVGHVVEADVAAPEWAAVDARGYVESTHAAAQEALRLSASAEAGVSLGLASEPARRLRRAVEVHETLRVGHADVFFPFPSVRRRWFTSEYALRPAELAAHYRATPLYQALHDPAGSLWRSQLQFTTAAAAVAGVGAADDFFVGAAEDGGGDAPRTAGDLLSTWSPLGVRRRCEHVDPLDMLQAVMDANDTTTTTAAATAAAPPLRVQVRHFVVTCSTRSMNAVALDEGGAAAARHRLPSAEPREQRQLPSSRSPFPAPAVV
ncbi:hypothetical protein NESM_000662700 [Novymonas esmeraldas]|uniref:Methyltransferase type 11 domain-containing protein n=1 Tax=Novymonas esmeraldas TaxID=1808958 RepID=A0AAW0EW83_9TRYP